MLTSNIAPAAVRLTVRPDSTCPQWRNLFAAAGWRPFAKHRNGTGMCTWLLKRGASVFAFDQSSYGPAPQVVQLPASDAAEVTNLMVSSGLALPA